MSILDDLNDDDILTMASNDLTSAVESRRQLDDRKLELLRLYAGWRNELQEGGKSKEARGPHGWAKTTTNFAFWIVETILPRVGVNIPTVTCTALNPAAVPFAQAKQMRTNQQWKRSGIEEQVMLSLKSFLILGEGFEKDFWDPVIGGPSSKNIGWFDFYISPEAARWREAEFIAHRTWHTRRGIEQLMKRDAKRTDKDGKKLPPLYDHEALEDLLHGGMQRDGSASDETYASVREAVGMGPAIYPAGDGQYALTELWYLGGEMVVLAGDAGTSPPRLVRVEKEPMYVDQYERAYRPFTVYSNTPNLFTPYAISDVETLEDFQHVGSTLQNQFIDGATRTLNPLTGIDTSMADPAQVVAAKGVPGGVFSSNGDPALALRQFPPQQVSGDYERAMQDLRTWVQTLSGVNDVAAAQQTAGGVQNDTATGAAIFQEEANKRWQFKLKLIQLGMRGKAQNYHAMDCQIGCSPVNVPLEAGDQLDFSKLRGITPVNESFARVGTEVNSQGLQYQIDVDAGSLAPPSQMMQAQSIRALVSDLMALPPGSVNIDFSELARRIVEAHGDNPETILLPMAVQPPSEDAPFDAQGNIVPGQPGQQATGPQAVAA